MAGACGAWSTCLAVGLGSPATCYITPALWIGLGSAERRGRCRVTLERRGRKAQQAQQHGGALAAEGRSEQRRERATLG